MNYEFTRQKIRTERRQRLIQWSIAALAAAAAGGLGSMWIDSHTIFGIFRTSVLATIGGAAALVITGAVDDWQR